MNMRNGQRPTDPIDVVVVGAGQAGLAVSYHLRAFGVEHIVLERGQIGESWRSARWNSFTLVTPSWMTRLPGYLLASPRSAATPNCWGGAAATRPCGPRSPGMSSWLPDQVRPATTPLRRRAEFPAHAGLTGARDLTGRRP
jgi:cation diffusion facilitator CzcD-associated flavoprotein CzcO